MRPYSWVCQECSIQSPSSLSTMSRPSQQRNQIKYNTMRPLGAGGLLECLPVPSSVHRWWSATRWYVVVRQANSAPWDFPEVMASLCCIHGCPASLTVAFSRVFVYLYTQFNARGKHDDPTEPVYMQALTFGSAIQSL